MTDLAPSMTEEELVSFNLSEQQVQSYHQFQQTWKSFNLYAPFVYCSREDEDASSPLITASWARYDITVCITSLGSWIVIDTGHYSPWSKTIPLERIRDPDTTDWCQTLISRILMISHGNGVTDMSNRGNIPWR